MTDGKIVMQKIFRQIVGMKPTRVKLGFGSFITMDFGKDVPEELKTKQGTQIRYHGEWHLWIYRKIYPVDERKLGHSRPR